jgi:hypothetical protein
MRYACETIAEPLCNVITMHTAQWLLSPRGRCIANGERGGGGRVKHRTRHIQSGETCAEFSTRPSSEPLKYVSHPRIVFNFILVTAIAMGRDSDWLRAGRPRGWSSSPGRVKIFLFSTSSRPALWPTQPPLQRVPGALSPRVKRPGREADHSPTSAEVKEMQIYTSTPPYAFMVY